MWALIHWRRPTDTPSAFKWRYFEGEMTLFCVRWYLRCTLSDCDVEELMYERRVPVDHSTVFRWVQRYAPAVDSTGATLDFMPSPTHDGDTAERFFRKVLGDAIGLYRVSSWSISTPRIAWPSRPSSRRARSQRPVCSGNASTWSVCYHRAETIAHRNVRQSGHTAVVMASHVACSTSPRDTVTPLASRSGRV
jgi:transposase-like protein